MSEGWVWSAAPTLATRLCLPGQAAVYKKGGARATKHLLHGQRLRVVEPVEPAEMRWEHQDTTFVRRLVSQIPAIVGLGVLLAFSYEVQRQLMGCRAYGTAGTAECEGGTGENDDEGVGEQLQNAIAALFVTSLNAGLPWVVVFIADFTEVHQSESDAHVSMMIKLVIARFVNTALLPFHLMPLGDVLSERSFGKVQAILIADCFMGPTMRIVDGYTRIVNKRILGPQAPSQEELNKFYIGSWWHLSDRYSAVLTTLFVSLYYSALMPTNIVITAFSFFSSYWVDKYLLFRRWEVHPSMEAKLSHLARLIVIVIVWVHLLVTTYFFAGWPFQRTTDTFAGEEPTIEEPKCWTAGPYCSYTKTVNENATHKAIVQLYNYLSALLSACLAVFFLQKGIQYMCSSTLGCSSADGDQSFDDAAEYTSCVGIDAYLPSIKIPGFVRRVGCVEMSEMSTTHQELLQGQAVVCKYHLSDRTYDVEYSDGRIDKRVAHSHLKHIGGAQPMYAEGAKVWGPQYDLTRDPLLPTADRERMHRLFGRVRFFDPDGAQAGDLGARNSQAMVLDVATLPPALAAVHNQV
jgi:hypothetical protein